MDCFARGVDHPRVQAGSMALLVTSTAHTLANFGKETGGVRERPVLGFHWGFVEAAKRGSTTAEVWVNKRIRGPKVDGRRVELTLDWLQTLVEDGIDWDEFEMVNTR
ncbi:hypothetical protein B0H13DRAFT_1879356 [Mycena leptocephala]|nr:hypothetical protein B0H13DRAFT_1879356 [Mycena leptocephala]